MLLAAEPRLELGAVRSGEGPEVGVAFCIVGRPSEVTTNEAERLEWKGPKMVWKLFWFGMKCSKKWHVWGFLFKWTFFQKILVFSSSFYSYNRSQCGKNAKAWTFATVW